MSMVDGMDIVEFGTSTSRDVDHVNARELSLFIEKPIG